MRFTAPVTVPCRCRLAPPPAGATCQHCNGTGSRLGIRDFQQNKGATDVPTDINSKENTVRLPVTKTSRTGRDPRDARVLIAGPPKVGKTTLMSSWAPDTTLLLDTHQGTTLLDGEHYVQPIASFGEFEEAIDVIVGGQHSFRTIGIDLIEDVWKLADRQAGERNNQIVAGLVEYGKGTAEAEGLFRRAIDKLLASPYGIWFVSHADTVQDGKLVQYVPRIDKRVRTYVEGVCQFVLLAEAHGPTRLLHTTPSARFQAGSRVPLPEPMPLDARNLYVEIAKGLSASATPKPAAAAAATTTVKEPIAA